MLKLQGWFDIFLCHLIQACRPVEKACAFTEGTEAMALLGQVDGGLRAIERGVFGGDDPQRGDGRGGTDGE